MHLINRRDAMYYIMTGETFDGKKAASMGLVNEAVWELPVVTRFYPDLPAYSSTGSTTVFDSATELILCLGTSHLRFAR
jgi:enoyl-CoA hydratase/carnithine racemase